MVEPRAQRQPTRAHNTESATMMLKNLPPQQKRKFSRNNRRATMFGDNWAVNEVAAVLVDKIDVEHRDESIVFGFQAADLKRQDAATLEIAGSGGQQQQRSSGGSSSQSSSRAEAIASFRFASSSSPVSKDTKLQQSAFIATRTNEPLGPAPPFSSAALSYAELDENTKSQPLVEVTAADEVSRRKRRRRASSIGAAAATELQQQQNAEVVANLLAQMETMKVRLGNAEVVQSKVLSALSMMTQSILQLDAFTDATRARSSLGASHGSHSSRESPSHRPLGAADSSDAAIAATA